MTSAPLHPLAPLPVTVLERRQETADTVTLELDPSEAGAAPAAPGQFHMLWAFGVGEAPISVSHVSDGRQAHTIRAVGAVTRALCDVDTGAVVGVRGPYGAGWDLDRARDDHVIVVAGGIGLAPLRPVVLGALERARDLRSVTVVVGARTPDDLLYAEELEAWREAGATVSVTVDTAARGWTGDVGVVTGLLPGALRDPARTVGYVCGPEAMIRLAARELVHHGVPADQVRVSLERNMHCAIRLCGRCQFGPDFVCADGPVFDYATVADRLAIRGL